MPRPWLTFALAVPLLAQTGNLATTDDGGVLLFTTQLRLAGTPDGPQQKVLRWDGKFSVVRSDPSLPAGRTLSHARSPVISGDGGTYGYSFTCGLCGFPANYVRNGVTTGTQGGTRLSHNGRYAVGGWAENGGLGLYRFDLTNGEVLNLAPETNGWAVTDGGDVLTQSGSALRLKGRVVANAPGPILFVSMSADGSRVVYVTTHDGLVDVREGDNVLVSLAGLGNFAEPHLSADGSRVLVIETIGGRARAFWMDLFKSGRHDLGEVRIGSATLSGDGRVAWLEDSLGRLTRVSLETGEREYITDPLPSRFTLRGSPTRGSLVRLEDAAITGGPWRVTLSNQKDVLNLPVLEARDQHVDAQIPSALPEAFSNSWLGLSRSNGALETVQDLSINGGISFWTDASVSRQSLGFLVKAVHQNFDRLVMPADPAQPGEVIHVYMSGLGPVAPSIPDLMPAPNPPPRITGLLTCGFPNFGANPARVFFAGLGVGMIGVYQVDVEVPQSARGGETIFCELTASGSGFGGGLAGYLPIAR